MIRKKLFFFLLAVLLFTLTLVSAPRRADACIWVCTDPPTYCFNGRLWAQNTCTGDWACVSTCAL